MSNSLGRTLLAAVLGVAAASVQAGGLWITEFGQPTQGRAGAGEQAGNGDATDAFFNPAAMSRLEKSELMLSAGVIAPNVEFDLDNSGIANGDGDGGNATDPTPGGSFFYAHPLNEKWSLGVSGVALTGSVLDYDDDWVGRYQVQDVSILVIGLVPSVAYQVNDKLSLGLSVPVMYSELDMDVAVPNPGAPGLGPDGKINLDGNDTQVAGTLALHYEFSDRTRFGVRGTSKFDFEYDGNVSADLLGQVGVTTKLTMAAVVRASLSHDINQQWTAHATWGWDNWSEMEDIFISTNTGGATLARDWDDTYHYAVGADYRMNSRWTLRAGIGYDTDPTRAKDRTADMPIDRQIRYAIGADYFRDSGMKVSGSLVYADYGDAAINSQKAPPLFGFEGEYGSNEIWFASLSFDWPFGSGSR
ncbi:MAG: outer membrane protein transport protein [Halieaceae bacterium]